MRQTFPEPTVGAVIFNPAGQILLVQSHKWRGNYVIPGGHIELGETIEAALRREVKEETNLDIYDIEFVDVQEFIFDDVFWEPGHFIFLDYTCKTDSWDVKLDSESEEFVWVSLEEATNLPIDAYTRKTLQACLRKRSVREC